MDYDVRDLVVVNRKTGEEIDVNVAHVLDGGSFNKVFLSELSAMIGCTGGSSEKVLGWILENKDNKNRVICTQRVLAKQIGVGLSTVSRVFNALSDNDFMKMIQSGVYLVNPKVIHYGGNGNKMAILKVWNEN